MRNFTYLFKRRWPLLLFIQLFITLTTFAQTSITGTVTATTGETLPGVSVVVKGTATGTTTDINGKYAIKAANANATLVFSYVGYSGKEEAVNGRTTVNVQLLADNRSLNEVVVLG